MSRHNYTNQAFCQDEESRIRRSQSVRSIHRSPATKLSYRNDYGAIETEHSRQTIMQKNSAFGMPRKMNISPNYDNKPANNFSGPRYDVISEANSNSTKSRYALVPMEYLSKSRSNFHGSTSSCLSRSHENLFNGNITISGTENFSSLPPVMPLIHTSSRIMQPAFSTDFGSKSFIMFDQKKYEIVPTEENEEIVDENHEIIQIHNGKTHRYAVIPTEDENDELKNFTRTSSPKKPQNSSQQFFTPQKQMLRNNEVSISMRSTPVKNQLATQKLYELLSTPQKTSRPASRCSTFVASSSQHAQRVTSPFQKYHKPTPQKLTYEQRSFHTESNTTLNVEQRTTAVIQPRINTAGNIYNETTTTLSNSENNESIFKKKFDSHKQTIAFIGYASIILMIMGFVNSGLCIYLTSILGTTNLYTSKPAYLDIGILSGFATVALSFLGFKFRFAPWMPNRHYVSGMSFIIV
jgi:hypothetical protein